MCVSAMVLVVSIITLAMLEFGEATPVSNNNTTTTVERIITPDTRGYERALEIAQQSNEMLLEQVELSRQREQDLAERNRQREQRIYEKQLQQQEQNNRDVLLLLQAVITDMGNERKHVIDTFMSLPEASLHITKNGQAYAALPSINSKVVLDATDVEYWSLTATGELPDMALLLPQGKTKQQ
jgi:hypothetical protein